MKNYFLTLMAHEAWANRNLITALRKTDSIPQRVTEVFPHMFTAHEMWYGRLTGNNPDINTLKWWPPYDLDQCEKWNEDYAAKWQDYLSKIAEPLDQLRGNFTSLKGDPISFRVIDCLTQLHSHSVNHRGQIAAMLNQAGIKGVQMDFIVYCKQMGL